MRATRILVVSGFAPYLGGPATWRGLAGALGGDCDVEIVDPLEFAEAPNVERSIALHIARRVRLGVDVVVAHGNSAAAAIKALAGGARNTPLVLLSPVFVSEPTKFAVTLLRGALAFRWAGAALTAIASRKLLKMLRDESLVERQIEALSIGDYEPVLEEALTRLDGYLTEVAVSRTAEIVRAALNPLPSRMLQRIKYVDVLLPEAGPLRVKRERLLAHFPQAMVRLVPESASAIMVDAPAVVAEAVERACVAAYMDAAVRACRRDVVSVESSDAIIQQGRTLYESETGREDWDYLAISERDAYVHRIVDEHVRSAGRSAPQRASASILL